MKKKNGFTLVELLAVIVILAVILVIAVPKITDTIKNSKIASFESSAKTIASQAEKDDPRFIPGNNVWHEMDADDTTNAVGHAACTLAKDIKAEAIIAITKTGYTATRMSKFRPATRIIAATPDEKTYHQAALQWGVTPIFVENQRDLEVLIARCMEESKKEGLLKSGDKVVISAGLPLDIPGNTNMVRVETVK